MNLSHKLKTINAANRQSEVSRAHEFLINCELDDLINESVDIFNKKIESLTTNSKQLNISLKLKSKDNLNMFDIYENYKPLTSDIESQIESEFNLRGHGNVDVTIEIDNYNNFYESIDILVKLTLNENDW